MGARLLRPHGRKHAPGVPAPDAGRAARRVRCLSVIAEQPHPLPGRAVPLVLGRGEP